MLRVIGHVRTRKKSRHDISSLLKSQEDENDNENDPDGMVTRARIVSNDYMNNEEERSDDEDDFIGQGKTQFYRRDEQEDSNRNRGYNFGIRRFSAGQTSSSDFSIHNLVLDPDGDACYYWLGVVTVAALYNIAVIILRLTFSEMRELPVFYIFDLLFDVIYIMDILMQFRMAYYDDGCLVLDPKQLRLHYSNDRRFKLDLLSIIPLHSIGLLVIGILKVFFRNLSYIETCYIYIPLSRIPRLIKVHTVLNFFEITDSRTSNPNTVRALKLSLYLWLVIHWIGCIYYMVSEYEGLGSSEWVYPDGEAFNSFSRKYTRCLYWSLLILTTIGERPSPETDLEYVFTGTTFIIGVFVFAAVVGNVGDVISNMNASRQDFQARMDQIKFYMHHRQVPERLQNRVKQWAEYSWNRTQAMDEPQILQMLPDRLRTEIAIQVHLDTLKMVSIFKECEEGLLRELVLKLKPQIFSPGDYICHIGEVGREMYIINHGKVEIVVPSQEKPKGTVVATLTSGNYFGEISLLKLDDGHNRRTADVRAVGYSELLCLSRKDLMTALVEYPNAKRILETQARERMQKMKEMRNSNTGDTSPKEDGMQDGTKKKKNWFLDVVKSPGFQKLLTNRGSELSELKSTIEDMKRFMEQMRDVISIQQHNNKKNSLKDRLQQTETELRQARSRIKELESSLRQYQNNSNSLTSCIKTKPGSTNGIHHDVVKTAHNLQVRKENISKSQTLLRSPRHRTSEKLSVESIEHTRRRSHSDSLDSKQKWQKMHSKISDRSMSSERTHSISKLNSFRSASESKDRNRIGNRDIVSCQKPTIMHSVPQTVQRNNVTTIPSKEGESLQILNTSSGYSSDTETLTMNTLLQVSAVLEQQSKEALLYSSSDENTDDEDDDDSGGSDINIENDEEIYKTSNDLFAKIPIFNDLNKFDSSYSNKIESSLLGKETNV